MNVPRIHHLMRNAIRTFDVQLQGLCVLTEAATGNYASTPVMAALAGAERVLCLSCGSRFGTVDEAKRAVDELCRATRAPDVIEFLPARTHAAISTADVITNLGFVRPIDRPLIDLFGPYAAVPLMWETWEFRAEDLDLTACREKQIPVLGTDEHHPDLQIFDYIGLLAVRQLMELDIEIERSRIAVWGRGEFADKVVDALLRNRASVRSFSGEPDDGDMQFLATADALVIVEHHDRGRMTGEGRPMSGIRLASINPGLGIAHICGGVDRADLVAAGLRCVPDVFAPAGYMSGSPADLGPRPVVDLHAAGLAVGAALSRARRQGMHGAAAEDHVLKTLRYAQDFPEALRHPARKS